MGSIYDERGLLVFKSIFIKLLLKRPICSRIYLTEWLSRHIIFNIRWDAGCENRVFK